MSVLKVLSRYVLREASSYFFISVFTFTGVLLTVRILKFANLILNKGVAASQIGMVFLAIIPTFLEIAIPMATLLGVMMAFARLSGDSEVIVIRASGISVASLIRPAVLFGILATTLGLGISLYARPWGYQQLSETLFQIARTKTTAGLDKGVFNKLGKLTLYVEDINHRNGDLVNVMLDDRRSPESRKVVFSKSGAILSNPTLQTITFDLKDGVIHEVLGNEYTLTRFDANRTIMAADEIYNPDTTEGKRRNRSRNMHELVERRQELVSLREEKLKEKVRATDMQEAVTTKVNAALEKEGVMPPATAAEKEESETEALTVKEVEGLIRKVDVEQLRRFSMPFAALLMAIIGLPLGIQSPRAQRTWGIGLSVTLGMVVFILYYGLLTLGVTLAEKGQLSAPIGVWLPNVIMLLLAAWLNKQIVTERWQSVTDGLEPAMRKLAWVADKMKGSKA